ncbi:Phospholipid:diacylglycerol acyltransferase [Candida viswanathii]|uniref:Phospholipid:diacylglycerol acyltransferase n=1 Tax=Candida viswanathii TaxID=5486 RepID=A0A367Y3T1_9ASCO|nr:Phospholipid:diacylglycerol acyltransferase [Candida viswanathii]
MSSLKNRKSASVATSDTEDSETEAVSSSIDPNGTILRPVLHDEPHHSHHHHNITRPVLEDDGSILVSRRSSISKSDDLQAKQKKKKPKKKILESRRVMFIFGTLIGLIFAWAFTTDTHPFNGDLEKFINFDQLNGIFDDWKNWKDILPNSIQTYLQESGKGEDNDGLHGLADSFSVGLRLKAQKNFTDNHNVVLVPGVVSTGLESWGTTTTGDCPSIGYFRKRLWGSFYMLRTMILEKTCWLKHIQLDEKTGLDPPNIKVRAAQGFEAADFFMAGYWIWNKILQNLAVIGYGPNNMVSASYDWRLAYIDLERRDGYFSKLKAQIELNNKLNNKKTVLIGHSMGTQIIFYFLKWVEATGKPYYGNGGPNWVNDHIESIIDISGSTLGTPKSIPVLISGEMKDTVQLNALAVYGLEQFFSRRERVDMLRTFGGVASMLPKGGDKIWGNLTHAPDDPISTFSDDEVTDSHEPKDRSFGTFIQFKNQTSDAKPYREITMAEGIDELLDKSPDWYSKRVRENYSYGITDSKAQLEKNNNDHLKWSNPLEAALPKAPDMKIYCFYGVGNPTERAYKYVTADKKATKLDYIIDADDANGVILGDGDGTVSLLTHSMCHEWAKGDKSRYNPANSKVTIVEIKHEPDRFDLRGGAKTAEHVDILGSAELNELILTVVSGNGDEIENRYVSNLKEIVEAINL